MKTGIHPSYLPTEIHCACGAVIETRSTKENLTVQICSSCHPFFTGKQKLMDTTGRIDRFKKKFSGKTVSSKTQISKPVKAVKKAAKEVSKEVSKEEPAPESNA